MFVNSTECMCISGCLLDSVVRVFGCSIFACHRSPLSSSECVSHSVSFSLVAGMFDGWFTWPLSTQTCPGCDLSVVVVVVPLTKISIGTNPVPLIGLGPVSNSCRQLLVKSSCGAYGRQLHLGITLLCTLQNSYRFTECRRRKSLLHNMSRTSEVSL